MNNNVKLLSWQEVNTRFFGDKLSYQALMYKARRGYIPSIKLGGRTFFEESALEDFFRSKSILMATADVSTKNDRIISKVPGIKKIA
ncbi:hypothetical protein [Pectinatus haikarae]|uniref:Helix-turn-helix domain-containing protein n=1 Tax=Pectinatus haikarae TaxID=349096 RepID=A0ABT9Y4S4_9FIRM|nr:hypothetical protein [Pectinatus haikarae]MDQ0202838.1 hypothetical protein [Pectinatus haikarae]